MSSKKIHIVFGKSAKNTLLSSKEMSNRIDAVISLNDDLSVGPIFNLGKKIYNDLCVTCHLPNGKGIAGTYPPLDGSNWLTEKREESIRGIKYGMQGPIEVNGEKYDNIMTPMGLSDKEVADAMNYVMNSWSNNIKDMVTEEEVAGIQKETE